MAERPMLARALVRVALGAALLSVAGVSVSAAITRARGDGERREAEAWQHARVPQARGGAWMGSGTCKACHPTEHATWQGTFHRTMTQKVGPDTVLGVFDGREIDDGKFVHRVERRGDEFWAYTADPKWLLTRAFDGPEAVSVAPPGSWQRVVMSTGSHHMQMYWLPAGDGNRLIAFPFAWSVEGERWVPNESTLLRPTEPYVVYGWNDVCIKCHAVAGEPGFREKSESGPRVQTKVAELGIACESCHGPGRAHVQVQQNPLTRYLARFGNEAGSGHMTDPADAPAREASEICAQCHSASLAVDDAAWLRRGSGYRAGGELGIDTQVVRHPLRADQAWIETTLDSDPDYLSGRFWGDGMIRISGRDYNGTRESPCFADEDFGCTTCHTMHAGEAANQLKPEAKDNRVCVNCHSDIGGDATQLQAHTRHAVGSNGSQCVNCHMPHTTYGLLKGIRSHEISSPSAQESTDVGRPNACNICHLDRSLTWAARELEAGWGVAQPELSDALDGEAQGLRWLVAGDAGQRALAAWYLGWAPAQQTVGVQWMAPVLARALDDEYAAVRWIALRSLRSLPGYADTPWDAATPVADAQAARAFARELSREAAEALPADAQGPLLREGKFDGPGYARLRKERDERIVDLRE